MTLNDWLVILAIMLAPIIAIRVQRFLDIAREKHQRRMWIFQTLMATRAHRVSGEHVQALNSIDIEFSRKKQHKAVIDTWKLYLDHLNTPTVSTSDIAAWVEKGDDLFTDLLYEMSITLKFDFNKVHLKRSIYSPRAHGEYEVEWQAIRRGLADILAGNASLPISVAPATVSNESGDSQEQEE